MKNKMTIKKAKEFLKSKAQFVAETEQVVKLRIPEELVSTKVTVIIIKEDNNE